jgi:hypothetical protein
MKSLRPERYTLFPKRQVERQGYVRRVKEITFACSLRREGGGKTVPDAA